MYSEGALFINKFYFLMSRNISSFPIEDEEEMYNNCDVVQLITFVKPFRSFKLIISILESLSFVDPSVKYFKFARAFFLGCFPSLR